MDDTPAEPEKDSTAAKAEDVPPPPKPVTAEPPRPAVSPAVAPTPPATTPTPVAEEPDSDDPDLEIPANATCRRKCCNVGYDPSVPRDEEKCVHHPGQPVFHEGSKGWSCCKRRVLEFDEFLKIQGCKEKKKHLFVAKGKPAREEKVETVR